MKIRPSLEQLERRDTPSTVVMGSRGALQVFGTDGADNVINVSDDGAGNIVVDGNAYNKAALGITSVKVYTTGGDDTIIVDSSVTIRDYIYSGDGNDFVSGGSGNTVIEGGAGDDTILGNSGDDVLGGGTGANVYDGGAGFDIAYAFGTLPPNGTDDCELWFNY